MRRSPPHPPRFFRMKAAADSLTMTISILSVTSRHAPHSLPLVRSTGGVFSGLNARTAQAKVRAVLNEPENRAVVGYHSAGATPDGPEGSADDALPPIARRVVRRIGPLMPDTGVLFAAGCC